MIGLKPEAVDINDSEKLESRFEGRLIMSEKKAGPTLVWVGDIVYRLKSPFLKTVADVVLGHLPRADPDYAGKVIDVTGWKGFERFVRAVHKLKKET